MPGRRRRNAFWPFAVALVLAARATMAAAGFGSSAAGSGVVGTAILVAPTALTVTGTSVANLSWSPSASTFATGTRVLRSTTPGSGYGVVATIADPAETIYHDSAVTAGTTYYYVVQAYYLNWSSPSSNQAGLTVVASPLRQQASTSHGNTGATTTTATFGSTPGVGDLIVVVAASRKSTTFAAPVTVPAWATATSTSPGSELQQAIFWKISTGAADKSITVSHGGSIGAVGVQIYEFAGVSGPVGLPGSSSSSSPGTALGSGTVTALSGAIVFAAVVSDAGTTNDDTTWTNGFSGSSFERGTNSGNWATFGSAWKTAASLGSTGTGVTGRVAANWRGQIVAFL